MRFLASLVICMVLSLAKIQAEEFNIEIPEDRYEDIYNNLMSYMPHDETDEDMQEINIAIPDSSFASVVEQLLDEIEDQLPEDSMLQLSYSVLEEAEENNEAVEKILNDEAEYMNDDTSDDDDDDDDDYLADYYQDDDYMMDDYMHDDESLDDEYLQDGSGEELDNVKENDYEEMTDNSCMARMCPRMYLPICATVDGVMRTLPSPCEYSNMVRCTSATNSRMGRAMPSFRVLGGGTCDEFKGETILSRKKRVAY